MSHKFIVCIVILTFLFDVTVCCGEPKVIEHVVVYKEKGRFGGWPANHGIWSWGDEILVGFSRGWYKDLGNRHHIDREKPEEHWFARSLDGGKTWALEDPSQDGAIIPRGTALHGVAPPGMTPKEPVDCTGGIDFTHPDFAMTLRMLDVHAAPCLFYYSMNRGKNWKGPFHFPMLGLKGIAARTDYLVNGKHDCMVFLTAAKSNRREGRPFCARTVDGGKTWEFVSWIGPEPEGFAIMPSSVRLSENRIITSVRRRENERRWIDTYISEGNGVTWDYLGKPVDDLGDGNPPCMIQLQDGRLCLTYGYRGEPFGIRAQFSSDEGQTWTEPFHLRDDGGGTDLGYVRTVQRPDGKIVSVYYFQNKIEPERYIAATIWEAGK